MMRRSLRGKKLIGAQPKPEEEEVFEVAVVGGDTSGLYTAALLGSMGVKTVLFEKNGEIAKHLYHFHKERTESHIHEEMAVGLQRVGVHDFLDEVLPKTNVPVTKPGRKALSSGDLLATIPMKKLGPLGYPTSSLMHQGTLNEHLLKLCQATVSVKFHHLVLDIDEGKDIQLTVKSSAEIKYSFRPGHGFK